ncbi:malignant fibrous histiocytoma-amplified sequence 1 homolog [Salarias fasciatus]|uniref:Roc domain-containing protein n=1 Tax=Salarias fasciatus TaxID=181472 RepID=A0A672IED1_SALFA|nr:malignant fibrous histiocytoma-amplified sequence 1 [Salarias fasciatus]
MKSLQEPREDGHGHGHAPGPDLKTARLWRDAALRSRKLRSDLRHLTLCAKDNRLALPDDLGHVEALDLGNNGLRELPDALGPALGNLRVLVLRRNKLSALPRAVLELGRLLELDLSHNLLRGLPDGLGRLAALQKLCVSHNAIQQLPVQLGALRALEELDLSFNQLRELPASFAQLARLRTLDADHNRLGRFPAEALALGELEELDCSGNPFRALPADVARLRAAKVLWLSGLGVAALPDGFCDLRRLESLMLDGNRLAALPPAFGRLQSLKMLNLSSNEFRDFPEAVLSIAGLEELYLSRNRLSRLPRDIARLENLVNLWLDNNVLTHLPDAIVELRRLEELVLQGNQIAVLPEDFGRLSRVNIWKVKGNPLVQPPYEVCLKGVPYIALYQQELARSQLAVKPRLKLVLLGRSGAGKTRLRRSLVGGAGAPGTRGVEVTPWTADAARHLTFLVYDLSGRRDYDLIQPFFLSPGALYVLAVNMKTYSPRDFYAHVGYFLRLLAAKVPDAVVVLVGTHADLCGEAELEERGLDIHRQIGLQERRDVQSLRGLVQQVDRALEQGAGVRASSPHAPFYAVSDRNLRRRRARLQFALSHRPRVLSPVLTVGAAPAGVRRLRDKLLSVADHGDIFPALRRVLPRSWQTLEELLAKAEEPWLSWWDAARLGLQAGLTEDRLHAALSFLHDSGKLLHFEDSPTLKDYIFHNLPHFTAVLDALFQRDEAALLERLLAEAEDEKGDDAEAGRLRRHVDGFLRHGVLPAAVLRPLLRPLVRTPQDLQLVAELLEKMGVCYCVNKPRGKPLNGGAAAAACYKFPGHVGGEEPPPDASPPPPGPALSVEQLHIRYSFPSLLPPGLFARFSVRIDRHVGRRSDGRRRILAYRGKVPVVIALRDDALSVASRAALPDIWTAWQAVTPLLEELELLLQEWPGLPYCVHILCSKCLKSGCSSPHAFPGELLTQPRPEGLTEVICPKNGSERVNVALIYPPTPTALSPALQ